MFQPVGGMGMIGKAFGERARRRHPLQRQGHRDPSGRQAASPSPTSTASRAARSQTARADWCVCTIPASVLSQIPMNVGDAMQHAIDARALRRLGQGRPAVQAPLLGSRTSRSTAASATPTCRTRMISYPSTDYFTPGKGVLLGAYTFGPNAYRVHVDVAGGADRNGASNTAPRSTRSTRPSSRPASPSPGTACRGRWAAPAPGPRTPRARALRQPLRDRRPHRAGGRARLHDPGLAGRRDPVLARRDRPAPSTYRAGVIGR